MRSVFRVCIQPVRILAIELETLRYPVGPLWSAIVPQTNPGVNLDRYPCFLHGGRARDVIKPSEKAINVDEQMLPTEGRILQFKSWKFPLKEN